MLYEVITELEAIAFDDPSTVSWVTQAGATTYRLVRAPHPTFAAGCSQFELIGPPLVDAFQPDEGQALYYLGRVTAPVSGSWGADSTGAERSLPCAR